MPINVRLDVETERTIQQLARNKGQTKSEVIREAIGLLARQTKAAEETERPYDIVRDLIGCVRGGPPDLSVKTGEQFQRILMKKRVT
jgi:hypothetical protein